jgi:hypothetical protein
MKACNIIRHNLTQTVTKRDALWWAVRSVMKVYIFNSTVRKLTSYQTNNAYISDKIMLCVCVCVCMCTHTHAHTHRYICSKRVATNKGYRAQFSK